MNTKYLINMYLFIFNQNNSLNRKTSLYTFKKFYLNKEYCMR